MDKYRQEVDGDGLSSYPHPWLMPDFWQFPTVSMGLGPIQAIYQAHVMKYLDSRELKDMHDRKIWCFMGDGECDEPESLGAIHLASREKLDNLIFVINCNLQRLDGPVRGNGRIMDELEGVFRGAGWNVLKVVWGRLWDPLFEKDKKGILQKRMDEAVDGEYQNYKANDGAYTREHFFGKYPETAEMVKDMSDEDIWKLNRGGHDPFKVYAAYHQAVNNANGRPTVVLAHTVKGYGMGSGDGEAANEAHQVKTMEYEALRTFRDRFGIPLTDEQLKEVPYYKPEDDSPELKYMHLQRERLGGYLPQRRSDFEALDDPLAGRQDLCLPDRWLQGPRGLDHHGLRAHAQRPGEAQAARQAGGADRSRRGAHLRHGGDVPPARHLHLRGPEVRARGQGPDHVLPRGQAGPDPRGGHLRGRRHVRLDRRGHLLQQQQPDAAAVLHLLLDVRLPAHR
jgi:pyruvate dehydrogenase E1 component